MADLTQLVRALTLLLMSRTKVLSLIEARLMLTFASAPSTAALASADAVVRSDFMFGFVIGPRASAIFPTSRARSATPKGTLVAPFKAPSMIASPFDASLACL